MMKQAQTKISRDAEFYHEDMSCFVKRALREHYDVITCGWALGYANPCSLLQDIKVIMKPGGIIGVIENQSNTLAEIREAGIKVMQRYPQHIRRLMDLTFRLPKNKNQLLQWFNRAGLQPMDIWDGKKLFCFKTGEDVLHWVLHTGASAGYDQIMDSDIKDLCDKAFIDIIEKDYLKEGQITTAHKFVAGIARK